MYARTRFHFSQLYTLDILANVMSAIKASAGDGVPPHRIALHTPIRENVIYEFIVGPFLLVRGLTLLKDENYSVVSYVNSLIYPSNVNNYSIK